MADSATINYSFVLVDVGGSYGTWGPKLNANFVAVDEYLEGKLDREGGTLTGPLIVVEGDAANPSVAFGSGTGLFSAGAGQVSVTCNGDQVASFGPAGLSLDSLLFKSQINGYVGAVQHLSLRPYQTDVNNGGIDVYTLGGGNLSFRVRVTEDGRIGIGTTTPAAKVDVEGNFAMKAVDLSSGTAIDCRQGGYYYKTISGNTTLTFTNVPTTGRFTGFVLEFTNGGAFTVNWPASVKWPQGSVPTLTTSGVDILTFVTRDGGTTWRGSLVQKGSA